MTDKAVHEVEQELDEYREEDGQINMVNIAFTDTNAKTPGIIAKLKTSSYQNSVNILCKIDTASISNILPFCIYKFLFPRSTKNNYHELKVKTLILKDSCDLWNST